MPTAGSANIAAHPAAGDDKSTPPALLIEGLSKSFRRQRVLDHLDLVVHPGEFFGLVGVNGAGKTTCIKGLLDFCAVDTGAIRIFGTTHRDPVARARLAYLPERFLPPYYLTGRDFLAYAARLYGHARTPEDIAAVCAHLDFDPRALPRPVRQYSKGMAQKLGLAACLLSGRELLVLDEPMSGLDPKARLLVKRHLQQQKASGRTLFFSTHMLSDVDELCDRMGILHGGRLRFAGTPAACRAAYDAATLEQAYLACISARD